MNENRRQILEMLAAGKITADEAEACWPLLSRIGRNRGRVHRKNPREWLAGYKRSEPVRSICGCSSRPMNP